MLSEPEMVTSCGASYVCELDLETDRSCVRTLGKNSLVLEA